MSGRLEYLECTYYPFSPGWQEKLREELLNLAHRRAKKKDGELYPDGKIWMATAVDPRIRKYQLVLRARLWS